MQKNSSNVFVSEGKYIGMHIPSKLQIVKIYMTSRENICCGYTASRGVSDVKKQKLMDFFKAPREVYECDRKRLSFAKALTEEEIRLIESSKKNFDMEKQLEYMERQKISFFFVHDKEYPEKEDN